MSKSINVSVHIDIYVYILDALLSLFLYFKIYVANNRYLPDF